MLADAPHVFPGRSLLGDTRGPVVDTSVDLDLGGHVYLTRQETWEAARLFGFVEPEVHEQQVRRATMAEAELAAARARLVEADSQLDAFRRTIKLVAPEAA